MKSITFLIPYFGKWPIWFSAFLISCQKNASIKWVFFTDCDTNIALPENVIIYKTTLKKVKILAESKLNTKITLNNPRKLCDLRPAYGKIFEDYIGETDFWGFCDVDVIWGDIRKFITNEILESNDIVSSRKEAISGHFTLFRNIDFVINYYKKLPQYNHILSQEEYMWAEEQILTNYLKEHKSEITVYWKKYFVNNEKGVAHQEYYLDRWLWDNGKVINTHTQEEVMYLHFINWKPNMKINEVLVIVNVKQFYISHIGMHFNVHTKLKHFINKLQNKVNGYHIKESRRRRNQEFKSLIKRVKRKLKSN